MFRAQSQLHDDVGDDKSRQQSEIDRPGGHRCDSQEQAERDVDQGEDEGETPGQLVHPLPDDPLH